MIVSIGILAALWVLVMVFRTDLRAHWWAYRITRAQTAEDRGFYAACLAAIGDRSLNALPQLLAHPDADTRALGVAVLQYCPSARARGMLLNMLGDHSNRVAVKTAMVLAQREDVALTLPELGAMLQGSDARKAATAAFVLQRIGGDEAERTLISALSTADDPNLRAQLIESLGLMASTRAESVLKDMLTDRRRVTRLPASQQSLQEGLSAVAAQLAEQGIDPGAVREATDPQPTVASCAARALQLIRAAPMPTDTNPSTSPG